MDHCPAIDGLIKEADEIAGEVEDKDVLDAAIIGAAQAVEHYEICRYGTLIAGQTSSTMMRLSASSRPTGMRKRQRTRSSTRSPPAKD